MFSSLLFPGTTSLDFVSPLPSSPRAPIRSGSPLPRFLDHFPATPSVPLALTLEKRVARNIRNIRARAHPVDYFESIITKRSGAGKRSTAATERERRGKRTKKRSKGTRLRRRGEQGGGSESRVPSRRSQEPPFRRLRFRAACLATRPRCTPRDIKNQSGRSIALPEHPAAVERDERDRKRFPKRARSRNERRLRVAAFPLFRESRSAIRPLLLSLSPLRLLLLIPGTEKTAGPPVTGSSLINRPFLLPRCLARRSRPSFVTRSLGELVASLRRFSNSS